MLDDCGEDVDCSIFELLLAFISHVVVSHGTDFAAQ